MRGQQCTRASERQVPPRWCQQHQARPKLVALLRLLHRQRGELIELPRIHLRVSDGHVQHDRHRHRKIRGQTRDHLLQPLGSTGGNTDHDDVYESTRHCRHRGSRARPGRLRNDEPPNRRASCGLDLVQQFVGKLHQPIAGQGGRLLQEVDGPCFQGPEHPARLSRWPR